MAENDSAQGIIKTFLAKYGLGELADWAWGLYTQGNSIEEIMLALREQPAYRARFPAMEQLAQQGHAITEQEYIQYEQTVMGLSRNWGLPGGMYDTPEGIADLLVKNVSAAEVNARLRIAAAAVYTAPPEVRQEMQRLFNLDPGDMVGYWLDPDKALPLLEQKYQAAEVAGAAAQQKLQVSLDEAMRLAQNGVTYDRAVEGFGQVATTGALAAGAGETADQAARTAAVFGDAAAQQKVQRVQAGRKAAFSGGGSAVETAQGVSGLGGAST